MGFICGAEPVSRGMKTDSYSRTQDREPLTEGTISGIFIWVKQLAAPPLPIFLLLRSPLSSNPVVKYLYSRNPQILHT